MYEDSDRYVESGDRTHSWPDMEINSASRQQINGYKVTKIEYCVVTVESEDLEFIIGLRFTNNAGQKSPTIGIIRTGELEGGVFKTGEFNINKDIRTITAAEEDRDSILSGLKFLFTDGTSHQIGLMGFINHDEAD